jgi:hypothetical protein
MNGDRMTGCDQSVDDGAACGGEIEGGDRRAGRDEGVDVLAAEPTEAAGDEGDVAVETKEIAEGIGRGQAEGLPPRDLQKTPETWRKKRESEVSRS